MLSNFALSRSSCRTDQSTSFGMSPLSRKYPLLTASMHASTIHVSKNALLIFIYLSNKLVKLGVAGSSSQRLESQVPPCRLNQTSKGKRKKRCQGWPNLARIGVEGWKTSPRHRMSGYLPCHVIKRPNLHVVAHSGFGTHAEPPGFLRTS